MNSSYKIGDVVICGGGDLWGNGAGQRAVLMAKVATGGDRVGSVMWRCRFADGEGRFAYGVDRNLYECQFTERVSAASSGAITSVTVINSGTGYTTAPLYEMRGEPPKQLTRVGYEGARAKWNLEPTYATELNKLLDSPELTECKKKHSWLFELASGYKWAEAEDVRDSHDELRATTQRLSKIKDDRIAELEAENKQLKAAVLQAQEMAKEIAANSVPKKTVEVPSAGQALANALRADRPLDAYGR